MRICAIDILLHRNNLINQSSKGKKVVQEEANNRAILTKQECQKKRVQIALFFSPWKLVASKHWIFEQAQQMTTHVMRSAYNFSTGSNLPKWIEAVHIMVTGKESL